jgi:hypothetical protein
VLLQISRAESFQQRIFLRMTLRRRTALALLETKRSQGMAKKAKKVAKKAKAKRGGGRKKAAKKAPRKAAKRAKKRGR